MDKVKRLVEAGASIPTAIKESLGMTVSAFAEKYGFPQATVSEFINGSRRPSHAFLAALISELGGTEDEWRVLLWKAGKPEVSSGAA